MGMEIAKARGIKPEYGVSFALGFIQLLTLQNELKTVKCIFCLVESEVRDVINMT